MNTLGGQIGEKIKETLNKKPTKLQTGILWIGGFALFIGILYIGSLFSSNEDFETKLLQTQVHNIDIELGKLGEQHNVYEKTRQRQQQAVDNTVVLMKGLEEEAKTLRAKKNEVEEKVKQVRATKHGILPQANAAELPVAPVVKEETLDMEKLAYAVGKHETGNCTLGYGKMYNNCVGLKSGNTAPCPVKNGVRQIGRNNMCIYDDPSESYEAFKTVWQRWYKGLPNLEKSIRYSGNDRATIWMNNVLDFYHNS